MGWEKEAVVGPLLGKGPLLSGIGGSSVSWTDCHFRVEVVSRISVEGQNVAG